MKACAIDDPTFVAVALAVMFVLGFYSWPLFMAVRHECRRRQQRRALNRIVEACKASASSSEATLRGGRE